MDSMQHVPHWVWWTLAALGLVAALAAGVFVFMLAHLPD